MTYKDSKDIVDFDLDMALLQKKYKQQKHVVNVLIAIKNLAKELISPRPSRMKESELTWSFLSGLPSFDGCKAFNANIKEEGNDDNNQRPDYRTDHFNSGQFLYSGLYGEIKAKIAINSNQSALYRLAGFGKNANRKFSKSCTMAVQVVGFSFFFYLFRSDGEFYRMIEFTSFLLPSSLDTLDVSLEMVNKMTKVVQVYQVLCIKEEEDDEEKSSLTIPLDFVEELLGSKPAKGSCCKIYIK
ncbi:hypothetical protein BD560DRAFT_445635 [Blakeslea trispora]|nr:hypothetical protein BD560DRAFT_445635 [Blakeslea trispora]